MIRLLKENVARILFLLALVATAYHGAFAAPFVYDDIHQIVGDSGVSPYEAVDNPISVIRMNVFRPIVKLSYWVDWKIGGGGARAFHFTNVILHAINVTLLYIFLLLLGAGFQMSPVKTIAFIVPAIFAVHPVMVESVTYISARPDLICLTFVLASFIIFLEMIMAEKYSRSHLALVIIFFLLALLSKETAAPAAVLALMIHLTIGRKHFDADRKKIIWVYASMFFILFAAAGLRLYSLSGREYHPTMYGWFTYLTSQPKSILLYLKLLFYPSGFSISHRLEPISSVAEAIYSGAYPIIFLLIILSMNEIRRKSLTGLSSAWFFLFLAPSSSIVPLLYLAAEHRIYIAAIGPMLIFVLTLNKVYSHRIFEGAYSKPVAAMLAALLLITLGSLTIERNQRWQTKVGIWAEASESYPDDLNLKVRLARELLDDKKNDQAKTLLEEVVQKSPDNDLALERLGYLEGRAGNYSRAEQLLKKAAEIDPTFVNASNNLGAVYLAWGYPKKAVGQFMDTLKIISDNQAALANLAIIYYGPLPDRDLAIEYREKIIRRFPGFELNEQFKSELEILYRLRNENRSLAADDQ